MAFSPLNQRLAEQQRHRENRGRLAHASVRVSTTGGDGVFEFADAISFGLTFVERPFISVGHECDTDQDALDDGVVRLPICTGYVTEWDKTDRDHYVGAWIAIAAVGDTEASIKIYHDFTFSGVAIKDVPTDV